MGHTLLSGLMLSALSACAEVPQAPADFDLGLASEDVWSGGELTILTPAVGSGVPVFEVFFDDAPLEARRADDTTLVVPLPDLPGAHRITATAPGSDVRVVPDVVRLHGFREHFQVAPLKGNLHAWPAAGRPVVLGVGATGPALVNLATRSAQTWSDSIHDPACNLGGIGASWRPDHFIFQSRASGTCTGYRAWQLLPTPTAAADSLPTPAITPACRGDRFRRR